MPTSPLRAAARVACGSRTRSFVDPHERLRVRFLSQTANWKVQSLRAKNEGADDDE